MTNQITLCPELIKNARIESELEQIIEKNRFLFTHGWSDQESLFDYLKNNHPNDLRWFRNSFLDAYSDVCLFKGVAYVFSARCGSDESKEIMKFPRVYYWPVYQEYQLKKSYLNQFSQSPFDKRCKNPHIYKPTLEQKWNLVRKEILGL